MSQITHHIPEPMLVAYASGALEHPFALVVAAHVSLCDECRARLGAHETAGGVVLEAQTCADLSAGMKDALFAQLDGRIEPERVFGRSGVYPGPIVAALKGKPPRWRRVGMGVRQSILDASPQGTVRLLYIPPGQAVPDHGHKGTELTLVLQGSFRDEVGRFGVGDLEVADQTLEHTPVAEAGAPCICVAATDAPLRFNGLIPRILQPFFGI